MVLLKIDRLFIIRKYTIYYPYSEYTFILQISNVYLFLYEVLYIFKWNQTKFKFRMCFKTYVGTHISYNIIQAPM